MRDALTRAAAPLATAGRPSMIPPEGAFYPSAEPAASNAAGEVDVLRLLAQLARKGAAIVGDDEDAFRVRLPGDRRHAQPGDAPARTAAPAIVARALACGWIAPDGDGRAYRLTEAGALALRAGPSRIGAASAAEPSRPAATVPLPRPIRRRRRAGASHALLSSSQAEAAERLEADFSRGQMRPRVTSNWDRAALGAVVDQSLASGSIQVADDVAAVQEKVRRALDDAGPEFAGILIDVCCLDMTLEDVERRRQWPRRTARVVLGLALDRLARHYGTITRGPARGTVRTWRGPGYRPA